jgi:putative tricarboxylic transport membrane protein
MRLNDRLIGAVLLVLSLAVFRHTWSFPAIPGQPYGAALFPRVVSIGLAVVSLLLIVQGVRSGEPLVRLQDGAARGLPAFATTLGALVFYVLCADRLGFIVCSTLMLVALLAAYGVRRPRLLPLAIGATLVVHTGFYTLLHVPLPWGVLEPFAW